MTIFLSRFKLNLCLTVTILLLLWPSPSSIRAVTENSPLLSQVQISGGPGKTTNDFIELYNPNQTDLDLKGLRLVKRAKTSSTDTLIKSWTSSTIIKAHSYYLWANSSFTDISATPDITTSPTIADDNAIAIRSGPNDTGTIIDSLAWGQANNGLNQSSVFPTNPRSNQSLERKPGTNSFFLQSNPHPRNSLSPLSSEPLPIETVSPRPEVSSIPSLISSPESENNSQANSTPATLTPIPTLTTTPTPVTIAPTAEPQLIAHSPVAIPSVKPLPNFNNPSVDAKIVASKTSTKGNFSNQESRNEQQILANLSDNKSNDSNTNSLIWLVVGALGITSLVLYIKKYSSK